MSDKQLYIVSVSDGGKKPEAFFVLANSFEEAAHKAEAHVSDCPGPFEWADAKAIAAQVESRFIG